MSEQRVHKKKMAAIREVYDRILWDARLDRSAFAIGYIECDRKGAVGWVESVKSLLVNRVGNVKPNMTRLGDRTRV